MDHPVSLSPALAVEIAGIRFPNPVLAAPGPLGFGREAQSVVKLAAFGGFITKTVTVEPREGNPVPHMARTDAGWLNSLGLPNKGLGAFLTRDLPFLAALGIPIVVSVAGHTAEEFVTLVEWITKESAVSGIELNLSCPNVEGGQDFAVDPAATKALLGRVRPLTDKPLIAKLSPNVTDIAAVARAAHEGGADALSLINTLTGMAIDVETRRPRLGAVTGGLSGPAIRPIAVRMVWEVAQAVPLPIIGMGGIGSAADALEFIIAGARAVAIAAAVIDNPTVAEEVVAGLEDYLRRHHIASIAEVAGTLDMRPLARPTAAP
ncbi:MAG TPA: dihydroorotate dehydrogenase [Gemmatimonadales bacterium]|nr:dihydroorotate dehydrogenase [Gemmatimonadales bacterium]